MPEGKFIAYVGDPAIHDGRVIAIRDGAASLSVDVRGAKGEPITIEFSGVNEVRSNKPVGMLLYSLSEMETSGPGRLFVFVNSDDEDDAFLEVRSLGIQTRKSTSATGPSAV